MEAAGKDITPFQRLALRSSVVVAVMSLILVVWWAAGTESEKKMLGGLDGSRAHVFNAHPVMMVLGFNVLMGQGIQAFRTLRLGKPMNKLAHASFHAGALVAVVAGLRAVFVSHNDTNAPNLYTAHGIVGLAVCVLFFAQYLVAALAFLSDACCSAADKAALLGPHALIGVCVYLFSVAAVVSGVAEKTAWMGCNYYEKSNGAKPKVALDHADTNPAAHYHLLPLGCKLGIGVSVSSLVAAFLVAIGVVSLRVGKDAPQQPNYHPVATTTPSVLV